MQKTLLVINGPTAIGKTALSIHLAQLFQTEIISTDSRQFYKELNIGTAKPGLEELKKVKHHFINNKSIHELYSAGDFERDAHACLDILFKTHDIIIAIGGSGLYIKALCDGLDEVPNADLELRASLIKLFEREGIEPLQKQLQQLNPGKWLKIDPQNPQRLMRAIELAHLGENLTAIKRKKNFSIVKIGLQTERSVLYERINHRVDQMFSDGLLEEAKDLFPFKALNALQTLGYNELFEYFEGKISLEKAINLIKQHTRNFAKRQVTWFRKDPDIVWFNPENWEQIEAWVRNTV